MPREHEGLARLDNDFHLLQVRSLIEDAVSNRQHRLDAAVCRYVRLDVHREVIDVDVWQVYRGDNVRCTSWRGVPAIEMVQRLESDDEVNRQRILSNITSVIVNYLFRIIITKYFS